MFANPATSVVCVPWLDVAACDELVAHLEDTAWSEGRIALPDETAGVDGAMSTSAGIRGCRLNHNVPDAIVDRLIADVSRINTQQFGFALDGPAADDPICAMRYAVGDHFDWHIDNGVLARPFGTRKLAFSVQLTAADAYEGGDLEFGMYRVGYGTDAFDAQRQHARKQGSLVVFAAFQLHRVAPVTRGVRTAIVGWLHGPPFK